MNLNTSLNKPPGVFVATVTRTGCEYVLSCLSHVRLFATPWTVAHQASLSTGFSRQEYWSGLPFPSPGDLPDSGIKPRSPALTSGFFTAEPLREAPGCECTSLNFPNNNQVLCVPKIINSLICTRPAWQDGEINTPVPPALRVPSLSGRLNSQHREVGYPPGSGCSSIHGWRTTHTACWVLALRDQGCRQESGGTQPGVLELMALL